MSVPDTVKEALNPISSRLAVGLVHHPVKDRTGTVVATNITNFDIHDIARAGRAYGVDKDLMFVSRILDHWRVGQGSKYNPMRKTALDQVRTATTVLDAIQQWGKPNTKVVGTSAREFAIPRVPFRELREKLHGKDSDEHYLLLFGTGFGMTTELIETFDYLLEPIKGALPADYRHLSVRSAVTICLDRLLGSW
jgi:hypothetical protein